MPEDINKKPFYWVYVKKEDSVFIQESKPKRKVYVSETEEDLGDQHYRHHFRLWVDGESRGKKVFESHHGFDRGPRRRGIIKRMILEA